MSKDSYSKFKTSDFRLGNISESISAAFGTGPKPSSQPRDSSVKKKLASLKEMSGGGKETFLTEAEMNEIEDQLTSQGYTPLSYEEMIKEVDDIRFGMKNRDYDLMELKKRLEKCSSEISDRESGFNGIDRTLNDIHIQNKELMRKIEYTMSLAKLDSN